MTIELYGTARIRAGVSRFTVAAESVGHALESLAAAYPSLNGTIIIGAAIHPWYRLSLNGERFISDPHTELADDDCLLLISADVGG